jgi:hypothetical protein
MTNQTHDDDATISRYTSSRNFGGVGMSLSLSRPGPICSNCWITFRARRPRPLSAYCHHNQAVATVTDNGVVELIETVPRWRLTEMRRAGDL